MHINEWQKKKKNPTTLYAINILGYIYGHMLAIPWSNNTDMTSYYWNLKTRPSSQIDTLLALMIPTSIARWWTSVPCAAIVVNH